MVQQKRSTIEPELHRRVLRFVNSAPNPETLMVPPKTQKIQVTDDHMGAGHIEDHGRKLKAKDFGRKPLIGRELAKRIFEERERNKPLYGYEHIEELLKIRGFNFDVLDGMLSSFGRAIYGEWEILFPGEMIEPHDRHVAHAALLNNGWVLLIPHDYVTDTILWNPEDGNPTTGIKNLPGATTGLADALFCCGHSFLSDGKLLAVGGGPGGGTNRAWKFDPDSDTWQQTSGSMGTPDTPIDRWYPTVVTLGDEPGRVLVVDGIPSRMEIYSELTDSFSPVWGPGGMGDTSADRSFPQLYPGLHLLPGGEIFYTPTGFRVCCNPAPAAYPACNPSAYLKFTGYNTDTAEWIEMGDNDRTTGMSVLLLKPTYPFVRVMVVGGGDSGSSSTARIANLSQLTPQWGDPFGFPDGLSRTNTNAVLLPDDTVFVCGGLPDSGGPLPRGGTCWLYEQVGFTNKWSELAKLNYERKYHAVALLLPSGKVGVTGGNWGVEGLEKIEVFSPPYLFNTDGTLATRPDITSFPDPGAGQIVLHGSTFEVGTADPCDISNVVLVRPMAVTHQTDTEQRVIHLIFTQSGTNTLSVIAPNGHHPHGTAPRGYYMLFILDNNGVPSVAKFIRLR